MPFVLPTAPKLDASVVEQHLLQITNSAATGPPGFLLGDRPESLSYLDPHRNYGVTLDAIAKGQLLSVATPGTWRYLITNNDKCVGELELASSIDEDNNEVIKRFVALHHGEAAQATLDVLNSEEASLVVQQGDYEVRFLRIVALYFDAVWLHSQNRDALIPIHSGIKTLRHRKAYSEGDIIGVLQPLALEAQRFDATMDSKNPGLR